MILIKDKIYITNPTNEDLLYWTRKLTYTSYDKIYNTYEYNEKENILILPRGVFDQKFFKEFKDETIKNTYIFPEPKFKLYEYQQKSVEGILNYQYGILKSACGSGKTLIALALICKLNQTSLILVDELKIQKQWETEVKKWLGEDLKLGLIGDGKFDIKPLTVVTVQTLRNLDKKKWDQINNYFGLLLVEESHMTPAETIYNAVNTTQTHYRFGITATPYRRDKLDFFMFNAIGPIIYEVDEKELDRVPIIINPIYTEVFFSIGFPPKKWEWWKVNLSKLIMRNIKRNNLIIHIISQHRDGLHLVLSERIEHCKTLAAMLNSLGIKTALLIGEVKSKIREELRKDGTLEVIIGTKVADKALDIPRIQYIHLTIPTANKPKLEQQIGRGARSCENKKECLVFDYIDRGIIDEEKGSDYFTSCFRNRVSFYRSKNYFFKAQ